MNVAGRSSGIGGSMPVGGCVLAKRFTAVKNFAMALVAGASFAIGGPSTAAPKGAAGDAIQLTITQSPTPVPYASTTFAGGVAHTVLFKNNGSNTVNKLSLAIVYPSSLPPQEVTGCVSPCELVSTATTDPTVTLIYYWPQLASGASQAITLVFKSPAAGALQTSATLSVSTTSADSSTPSSYITKTASLDTSFGVTQDLVSAYILKGIQNKLTADRTGKFTSTVTVPPPPEGTPAFLATVFQYLDKGSCVATYQPKECQNVQLTIPGTYNPDPLVMEFVRDASTLAKTAKIRNVVIYHLIDENDPAPVVIQSCEGGLIPSGLEFCVISEDFTFVQGGVLLGYWKHTVKGFHNGLLLFR
jgi:hypothetical protein